MKRPPKPRPRASRTYGGQADEAAKSDIAAAVKDFYAAKAAGDAARACALLAGVTREALVETMARSSAVKGKDCAAIVGRLLTGQEPGYRERIKGVEVTGARVSGDRGLALIDIEAIPEEVIPVRRESGSWRVAAIAGSEIP